MVLPLRFLIDECLSPKLVDDAYAAGFEAAHAGQRGLLRTPDPQITRYCLANDMTVVTNNARNFRSIYARLALHPGLVVVLPKVQRPEQRALFRIALARLRDERDLVNKLVEVDSLGVVTISDFPPA